MDVINALEVIFHLRVIESDHLHHLFDCQVVLTTFQVDAKLPGATLNPELKRATALSGQEVLSLLEGLLSQEKL